MIIFSYGSNLCLNQMRARIPNAVHLGPATLDRCTLAFAGKSERFGGGVATLRLAKRGLVRGALYMLTPEDVTQLDRYEGTPHVYRRVDCEPKDADGTEFRAQTYVLLRNHDAANPPSLTYFQIVEQGYRDWKLPRTPLMRAVRAAQRSVLTV